MLNLFRPYKFVVQPTDQTSAQWKIFSILD